MSRSPRNLSPGLGLLRVEVQSEEGGNEGRSASLSGRIWLGTMDVVNLGRANKEAVRAGNQHMAIDIDMGGQRLREQGKRVLAELGFVLHGFFAMDNGSSRH
jgi:hypothetical protein